jgi:hypothetical protein
MANISSIQDLLSEIRLNSHYSSDTFVGIKTINAKPMKMIFIPLLALVLITSCQKSDYSCTYNNWPSSTSQNTFVIHDTKYKAKKQCEANNPKPNRNKTVLGSNHCGLN